MRANHFPEYIRECYPIDKQGYFEDDLVIHRCVQWTKLKKEEFLALKTIANKYLKMPVDLFSHANSIRDQRAWRDSQKRFTYIVMQQGHVKILAISTKRIKKVPKEIAVFSELEELIFHERAKKIKYITNPKLTKVDLSYNQMKKLGCIHKLPNLEELNVYFNMNLRKKEVEKIKSKGINVFPKEQLFFY